MAYYKTNISQKCGNKSCTCVIFIEKLKLYSEKYKTISFIHFVYTFIVIRYTFLAFYVVYCLVMIMKPYAPHPHKLLQGRKKQQILTEDGYVFTKERQYKDKVYYKCVRWFDGCKSRLTMCSNSRIITRYAPSHSHIADPVDNTVRELKSRMKDSSKERMGATLVIADTVSGATDEVLSQLSTNTAMSQMIWRERKDKNIPRGPQNLEFDIPQDMTTLHVRFIRFFFLQIAPFKY